MLFGYFNGELGLHVVHRANQTIPYLMAPRQQALVPITTQLLAVRIYKKT